MFHYQKPKDFLKNTVHYPINNIKKQFLISLVNLMLKKGYHSQGYLYSILLIRDAEICYQLMKQLGIPVNIQINPGVLQVNLILIVKRLKVNVLLCCAQYLCMVQRTSLWFKEELRKLYFVISLEKPVPISSTSIKT